MLLVCTQYPSLDIPNVANATSQAVGGDSNLIIKSPFRDWFELSHQLDTL